MAEKKQIICPKCKAKLKFDPSKITAAVVKFKCPGCDSVLRFRKPEMSEEPLSDAVAGQAESTSKKPESRAEAEQAAGVEPSFSEKTEEVPVAQETLPEEKYSPPIPEDGPDLSEEPVGATAWDLTYDDLNELESRAEAELAAGVEPSVSEKTEEVPAAQETLPEERYSPPIPEDSPVVPEASGESPREDFAHEDLREPESRAEAEQAAGVEPPVSEKTEEENLAAQETLPEERYSPPIPEDSPDLSEEPVASAAWGWDPSYDDFNELETKAEAEQAAGVEPPVSEKTEEEIPAAQETPPEDNKVVCQNCKTMLKFDPARITSEFIKAKCPSCGSLVTIRKPGAQIEPSPLPPVAAKSESGIAAKPDTEIPRVDRKKAVSGEALGASDQAAQVSEPVEPPVSEKIEEAPAPKETVPRATHGPRIPEDRLVVPEEPIESILEDFDHENLKEYEEGEVEEGDLEWTRYTERKGPTLPRSQIDLEAIPATADALQDTLADLQQAEMSNFQGEKHLEKNRVPQAIRDFSHALEINPDYGEALVNRGSAYVLQNDFNAALNDFNHALELEPKEAEIYNIRGEIYLLNSMYDEAIRDFTAAIILNPVFSDAYLNRAKAYNGKGLPEEAEYDFNQAIRADSEKIDGYVDLAGPESLFEDECSTSFKEKAAEHMHQGLVELKGENFYEAVENFTKVINLEPGNALAYINRARAYVELGQTDEAMVDLKRAVIYDPLNPTLYYWRAMVWKTMDSPINMVADLKLACELGYEPAREEYEKYKPRKN